MSEIVAKHVRPVQRRSSRIATGGYDTSSGEHVATWQLRVTPKGVAELHKRLGGSGPLLIAV